MASTMQDMPDGGAAPRGCSVWSIIILVCAGAVANPAAAGRPLATEDAAVLGAKQCEIESFGAKRQGAASTYLSGQLGCGIGLHTQLAVVAATETEFNNGQFALTGKTSFIELTAQGAGLAVAYAVAWQKNRHDSVQHESVEAKAVLTVPLDDYLLHANAGWIGTHADHLNCLTWSAAVEKTNAFDRVDLMMELFGDSRTAPLMQFAARWAIVPERLNVDASWGIRANAQKDQQASLGMRFAF